ncbi:MAG: kynureninase [Chloroflexi bacterium RBG_16_58_14]|nr:MAG: kynureninase [Chloroflexi bacterium RBG_16_58_14]
MDFANTELQLAYELGTLDELAAFRQEFVIEDQNLIYLDGNSLGRLPKRTVSRLEDAIQRQWGERLIRAWNDGWIHAPDELGGKIAALIGAQPDEVLVADATSINLFKLAIATLASRPERTTIVSDEFNFPSDLYIFQGIIDLLGNRHKLRLIPSRDGVTIDTRDVEANLGDDTALLSLSHVAFKSAYLYDMARVTELAHTAGALVLWDLSHSVGALPIDLNGCDVDLAVGCTYKYLNGGPGAPAFLYVRRDLQEKLVPPMWGWFAAKAPFDFELQFTPAANISRFRVGTVPMLSMQALEPALDLILQAGVGRLRLKSVQQTDYLIYLAEQWLLPLGFTLGSPRSAEERGSHVSLRHPEGYRICRALIESPPPAVQVIPDFRTPDNIRLGIAPIYTSYADIHRALERMRVIVEERIYEQYTAEKLAVT